MPGQIELAQQRRRWSVDGFEPYPYGVDIDWLHDGLRAGVEVKVSDATETNSQKAIEDLEARVAEAEEKAAEAQQKAEDAAEDAASDASSAADVAAEEEADRDAGDATAGANTGSSGRCK